MNGWFMAFPTPVLKKDKHLIWVKPFDFLLELCQVSESSVCSGLKGTRSPLMFPSPQ